MHIIGDAPPFSSRIEFTFSPTSPPKLRVDQLINRWRTIHSKISNSLLLQRGPWKEVASVKNMFLVFFVQGSKRETHLYITRLGFKPNWSRAPIMLISHLNQKGNMWYRGTSCLPSIKLKTCVTGGRLRFGVCALNISSPAFKQASLPTLSKIFKPCPKPLSHRLRRPSNPRCPAATELAHHALNAQSPLPALDV
jgi:hypothetical protein